MQISVREHTDDRTDRQYIPNGWTAKIVDGETVFKSPTGGIETTDVEEVSQIAHQGGA